MYSFMTLFLSFFQSASTELSDSVRQITKTQKELFSTSSLLEKKTEIFQDWMFQIAGLLNTDKINKNMSTNFNQRDAQRTINTSILTPINFLNYCFCDYPLY